MVERDGEDGKQGLVVKIGYQRCPLKAGSLPFPFHCLSLLYGHQEVDHSAFNSCFLP